MTKIPKKLEWLVIIYDKPVNQRLKFRAQHLAKVPSAVESGAFTMCGPIFKDETKSEFIGSSFTIQAETESEVIDILKKDIYAAEDVWDFDNVVIHPFAPFFRQQHDMPNK